MNRMLDIAAVVFATLLVLLFAAASLRGAVVPETASAGFGLPVQDAAGAMYYRVYASRNLVIVAAAAAFSARKNRLPIK